MFSNPKTRQTIYLLGSLVTGLLSLAVLWGAIDQGVANHLGELIVGFLGLAGASTPALAASKTSEQRRDGTFDQTADPAMGLIESLQKVGEEARIQADSAKSRAASGLGDLINMTTGGLAGAVANSPDMPGKVDDLIRAMAKTHIQ